MIDFLFLLVQTKWRMLNPQLVQRHPRENNHMWMTWISHMRALQPREHRKIAFERRNVFFLYWGKQTKIDKIKDDLLLVKPQDHSGYLLSCQALWRKSLSLAVWHHSECMLPDLKGPQHSSVFLHLAPFLTLERQFQIFSMLLWPPTFFFLPSHLKLMTLFSVSLR